MSTTVLTDEIAKICTEAHISNCRLVVAPFLNRKAFEQNESLAIEYLGSN
jgi:hypothetical protein